MQKKTAHKTTGKNQDDSKNLQEQFQYMENMSVEQEAGVVINQVRVIDVISGPESDVELQWLLDQV